LQTKDSEQDKTTGQVGGSSGQVEVDKDGKSVIMEETRSLLRSIDMNDQLIQALKKIKNDFGETIYCLYTGVKTLAFRRNL